MAASAIGFLIISFCVRVSVTESTVIPLLPAFIGYFFVMKGLKAIREENTLLGLAYKIAKIAILVTLAFLVLYVTGVEKWANPLYHGIKILEILASIILVYIVIEGIVGMEEKYGYSMCSYELRKMWSIVTALYAIIEVAAYVEQIPPWLTAILLIIKMMFTIMFMQKYIEASQLYDRREAQGKFSKEEDGPRFRL